MTPDAFQEPVAWSCLDRLRTRLPLAHRVFRVHPTMPATAYWRIYEAEVILRGLHGSGRGLDLGCGDGSFASVLFPAAPGLTWTGVEPDEIDAELARRSGRYEAVLVTGGEDMPIEAGSFDVVFSNCVLEHVEGLDAVLERVGRLLKPGGRFLFTVPSEAFYDAILIPRLLGGLRLRGLRRRYVAHLDRRLEMRNVLDLAQWRGKLERNGLSMEAEVPYATRMAASLWELVATMTGGVAYWVARGAATPRKIQQSAGLARPDRGWLGSLCFALLLPLILISAGWRNRPPHAGRFVVARKAGVA